MNRPTDSNPKASPRNGIIAGALGLLVAAAGVAFWVAGKVERGEDGENRGAIGQDASGSPGSPSAATPRARGASKRSDKSLADYQKQYAGLAATREGSNLHNSILELLYGAAEHLSAQELESLCAEIKDIDAWRLGMELVGSKYAREDTAAGYRWLSTMTQDSAASAAFSGFGSALPPDKVAGGVDFALKLQNKAMAGAFLSGIMATGDLGSIRQVVEVTNNNPKVMAGGYSLSSAPAALLLAGDHAGAVEISGLIKDGPDRRAAYRSVVMGLVKESPSKASQIVGAMPHEADRASVVDALVKPWIRQDPEAASQWVSSLPKGPARDSASSAIVTATLHVNQEDALGWALDIQSEPLRKKEIRRILEFTRANNPGQLDVLTRTLEGK